MKGASRRLEVLLLLPKGVNNRALGTDVSKVTTAVALLTAMDSRTNRDRSCSRSGNREAVNVWRAVVFVAGFVSRATGGRFVAIECGVWSSVHSGEGDLSLESAYSIKESMLFDGVAG